MPLSSRMHARIEPISELSDTDIAAWRALAADPLEPNPAVDPDLLLPAVAHTHAGAGLRLVLIEADGLLQACLPIRRIDRWRRFERVGLTSRLDDTAVPVLPVLGAPLVRRQAGDGAVRALLVALRAEAALVGASWIVFERLNRDGEVARLLEAAGRSEGLPSHTYDHWERPVLKRRTEADGWAAGLSQQRLRDQAKKKRRLERDAGGEVTVVDRRGEPGAIDDLLRIEASGWKGAEGTAMATHADQAAFLRACVASLDVAGHSHLLTLEAAGQAIAVCWAVESGDILYLLRIAFDERFARCSPGGLLETAAAEFFHRSTTAAIMDPCCAPSNAFHSHFLPDRQSVCSMLVGVGSGGDRALVRLLPVYFGLRDVLGWARSRVRARSG
jgi:CelD/BcsL family acetyltransferase involved in cellulose biosynthesis